jgi:hypothetical protein
MRRQLMILALGALVVPTVLLAADGRVGTWKFNAAKSKFQPGPAYKSRTVKIEAAGEGVKVAVDGVSGDGKAHSYSYTVNYDGKDYPVTGNPAADTIAYKKVDESTVEATSKKGGQVTVNITIVLAKDGKSMTVTSKGKDDKGPFTNVAVYDRQ